MAILNVRDAEVRQLYAFEAGHVFAESDARPNVSYAIKAMDRPIRLSLRVPAQNAFLKQIVQ